MVIRTQLKLNLLIAALLTAAPVFAGEWQGMTTAQMILQSESGYEPSGTEGNKLPMKELLAIKEQAAIHLSSGEYASAVTKYNLLLAYDWDDSVKTELLMGIGYSYEGLKQYDMALKYFQESAEVQPKNSVCRLNLARIYDVTGMESQAMAEYKKVIEFGGDKFTASNALGRIYEQFGFYSKAIENYSQALLVKSSPQIYRALSRCYEASNRRDLASSMLIQAMSGNPDAPTIEDIVHLAYLYSIQQKYDDAVGYLLDARAREPENEEITAHLAAVYFKKGDIEKAKKTAAEYKKKNPGSALAHFISGFVKYFEGKHKEAAAEMKRTLELKPTPMLKEYAQLMLEHSKK